MFCQAMPAYTWKDGLYIETMSWFSLVLHILWELSNKITAVTVKVGKSYRVQVSTLCLVLADNAIDLHGQE